MAKSKKKVNKKEKSKIKGLNEVLGVLVILVGVLILISLFANSQSIIKTYTDSILKGVFGVGAYVLPVVIIGIGVMMIMLKKPKFDTVKLIMSALMVLSGIGLVHMCFSWFAPVGTSATVDTFKDSVKEAYQMGIQNIGLGAFAALYVFFVTAFATDLGAVVIFFALIVISLIVLFNLSLKDAGEKVSHLHPIGF